MGDPDRRRLVLLPALLLFAIVLIPVVGWVRFACPACEGRGWSAYRNPEGKKILDTCPPCEGAGNLSLFRRVSCRPPP